jgi:outer membrane lipoprotein LolB
MQPLPKAISHFWERAYLQNLPILALVGLLSGCEIFPAPFVRPYKYDAPPSRTIAPPAEGDLSRGEGAIQRFELTGRIAIRQGSKNDTLLMDWSHEFGVNHIAMRTPLGGQVMRLDEELGKASLKLPDHDPEEATSSEPLLKKILGSAVPLEQLAKWVTGEIPVDGSDFSDLGDEMRVVQFKHKGWVCSLQNWRIVGGQSLPGLIQISQTGMQIRLVIDRWNLVRGKS